MIVIVTVSNGEVFQNRFWVNHTVALCCGIISLSVYTVCDLLRNKLGRGARVSTGLADVLEGVHLQLGSVSMLLTSRL